MLLRTPCSARSVLKAAIQEARFDKCVQDVILSNDPVYEIERLRPGGYAIETATAHLVEVAALRVDVVEPPERTLSRWIETQMSHARSGDVLVIGTYGVRIDNVGVTFFAGFLDTGE